MATMAPVHDVTLNNGSKMQYKSGKFYAVPVDFYLDSEIHTIHKDRLFRGPKNLTIY